MAWIWNFLLAAWKDLQEGKADPAGFPSGEARREDSGLSLRAELAQNGTTAWGSASAQHLRDGGFIRRKKPSQANFQAAGKLRLSLRLRDSPPPAPAVIRGDPRGGPGSVKQQSSFVVPQSSLCQRPRSQGETRELPQSKPSPQLLLSSWGENKQRRSRSFVAGMSHIWFELQEMHFHPLPELFMLNKQNPGDFARFWLWDNFGAALSENSRLVLHFTPSGSSAPRSPGGRRRALEPPPGNAAEAGTGSALHHSV